MRQTEIDIPCNKIG